MPVSRSTTALLSRSGSLLTKRYQTKQLRSLSTMLFPVHFNNITNIIIRSSSRSRSKEKNNTHTLQRRWSHHEMEKRPVEVPLPVHMGGGIDIVQEIARCREELATLTDERQRDAMQVHINVMDKIETARQTGDTIQLEGKEAAMCALMQTVRKHDKLDVSVRLTPTMHFLNDLGLDSLDLAELVMMIEETFIIQVPDEEAFKLQTIADTLDFVVNWEYTNIEPVTMGPPTVEELEFEQYLKETEEKY